jgi:hypothetical protein
MKSVKVVIFSQDKTNATILNFPSMKDVEIYKKQPNVVINPELKAVNGLPPHEWKLVGKKTIIPKGKDDPRPTEDTNHHDIVLDTLTKSAKSYKTQKTVFLCFLIFFIFTNIATYYKLKEQVKSFELKQNGGACEYIKQPTTKNHKK